MQTQTRTNNTRTPPDAWIQGSLAKKGRRGRYKYMRTEVRVTGSRWNTGGLMGSQEGRRQGGEAGRGGRTAQHSEQTLGITGDDIWINQWAWNDPNIGEWCTPAEKLNKVVFVYSRMTSSSSPWTWISTCNKPFRHKPKNTKAQKSEFHFSSASFPWYTISESSLDPTNI